MWETPEIIIHANEASIKYILT